MEAQSASALVFPKETNLVLTAATFALSFIVIGIPLWWKTTTVPRVSLPYSEIEQLPSLRLSHVIPVTVICGDKRIPEGELWEELKYLSTYEYNPIKKDELLIHYEWRMRIPVAEEEAIINNHTDIHYLDEHFNKYRKIETLGTYDIIIFNPWNSPPDAQLVGCHRRGYVAGSQDIRDLGKKIIGIVRTMVQTELLKKMHSPPSLYEREKPEKDKMRSLRALTAFDITFSLFVPEPHLINPQWNIEEAIKAYINPFLSKMSLTDSVDIKSQILYMTQIPFASTMRGADGENYLNEDQLPSIINPVEEKLGSYASVNPNLNFVVYISPKDQSPLYIVDKKGDLVSTNAFLSPRWGGFLIKNVDVSNGTDFPQTVELDMTSIMGVFLAQLKQLLGLPKFSLDKDYKGIEAYHSPAGCEWEHDFLLRKSSQEQLSIAISSLYSLGQLLQTINNIVIQEEVGKKIYSALWNIKNSLRYLEDGNLEEGSVCAKNAFNFSEEAFFDPTLLSLLYFPEDQKYAIYIPLFLPISIPVIMSMKQIWAYWKGSKSKEKKE